MSAAKRNPGSIHKALNLPSKYAPRLVVEGHVSTGESYFQSEHVALRMMTSPTLGAVTVWAKSVSWGPWSEIEAAEFRDLASKILNRS